MTAGIVDQVINAVLYEGYLLYPYRLSSIKNQHRFNFGIVFPQPMSPSQMTTECIVVGSGDTTINAEVRFLQVTAVDNDHEVVERRVSASEGSTPFRMENLHGVIEFQRIAIDEKSFKVRIRVTNQTCPGPPSGAQWNQILCSCLVSTHIVIRAQHGEFISMLDPPAEFISLVDACMQEGSWPVLVGRDGDRTCMLSSPIILYDYPHIAPESPENLFDGTEIDEILLLRILSLTPEEKEEIRRGDAKGRSILEHAEKLTPEELLKLHGTRRDSSLRPGDRVRLHPRPGADAIDTLLDGRTGIIEAVEEDFEKRIHIAVVFEDDPGLEFGLERQPGHRFFFSPDEVEVLP